MPKYTLYVCDTETTGLDREKNDIIELSLYRMTDDTQKTWCIKPMNTDGIEQGALRVNGHKLEDILWQTKYGRETYLPADKVLPEIENWLMEDGVTSNDRILCGHNIVGFDRGMLETFWKKCNASETYPFNVKYMLDTFQIEFFIDYVLGTEGEGYSLSALGKKYGIKNDKAHSAGADTRATRELLVKQIENLRKRLNVGV